MNPHWRVESILVWNWCAYIKRSLTHPCRACAIHVTIARIMFINTLLGTFTNKNKINPFKKNAPDDWLEIHILVGYFFSWNFDKARRYALRSQATSNLIHINHSAPYQRAALPAFSGTGNLLSCLSLLTLILLRFSGIINTYENMQNLFSFWSDYNVMFLHCRHS